jgi:uncharacterized protein YdhG (YjbR/CyaY superfamily)
VTVKAATRLPVSVDEYIARFPPEVRSKLEKLRKTIHEAASDISERISYRMPAFERQGILVWFAAFAKHIGFFPTAEGVAAFKRELGSYAASKGTVQFPLDSEPPYALVKEIVKHRVRTNAAKATSRAAKAANRRAVAKKPGTAKKPATRAAAANEKTGRSATTKATASPASRSRPRKKTPTRR